MYNEDLKKTNSLSVLLCGQAGIPLLSDAIAYAASILEVEDSKVLNHPDFLLLSSQSSMGVSEAEAVIRFCFLKPSHAKYRVVLIDRIDTMTIQGQNKLLKQLEDCSHVRFVLTAYNGLVLPTIKSRLAVFLYRPLTKEEFQSLGDELDYYITNGCPDLLLEEDYPELRQKFKSVQEAVEKEDFKCLLKELHLVQEKDPEHFFSVHPELVSNMLEFIGICFLSKPMCDINLARIRILAKNLEICREAYYTKENFFLCIAALKGGNSNEFV